MPSNFNAKSPAVKRILQEIREMEEVCQTCTEFAAEAMEDDIFEWNFVIAGPSDTDFAGGIYHGRILLPPDYPFKPPSFVMLTPTGRFQTHTKICLSISSHHPEHWQPSWSVRTALTALIAFFPTHGSGAVGSLDLPSKDKKALAAKSRLVIPQVSSDSRRCVMDKLHKHLLAMEQADATALTSPGRLAKHLPDKPGTLDTLPPSDLSSQQNVDKSNTNPITTQPTRYTAKFYEGLIDKVLCVVVGLIAFLCFQIVSKSYV